MKHLFLSLLFLTFIQLTRSQIPNNSFENWNISAGYEYPDNWTIDNDGTITPGAIKDTTSYIGEYAWRLSRASMSYVSAICRFPISYHPSLLNLFLKGDQHPKDTLKINVWLYHFDVLIDTGFLEYTQYVTDDYTAISVEITQNTLNADSAIIELKFDCRSPLTDVVDFYIDHLYFDDNIGISPTEFTTLEIFPSPATDYIIIQNPPPDFKASEIIAVNSTGQSYVFPLAAAGQINISSLLAGSYQLMIRTRAKKYLGKFLKV